MHPQAPDARLSNYRLDRLLGAGGMGSVYLAHDLTLRRDVAIKFIPPELAGDEAARRRLIREARAAAALDHPNICGVHDAILTEDGRACIVMQYVEGETLAAALRGGPLDVRHALTMASELTAALAAAHRRGIVHRDIKPQNVMITPSGRVKLLEFRIARVADPPAGAQEQTKTSMTGPGFFAVTPAYISPEQIRQQPVDARSDLFSLGAVIFEALTGRRAFAGPTLADIYGQILHEHPPAPSSLRPELTTQHDELCRRLLAKHPQDRFASAEELAGALRVLSPDTAHATGGGIRETHRAEQYGINRLLGLRPFRAGRMATAAGGLVLILGAIALAGWWRPAATSDETTIIGVLPFRNDSADPRHDLLTAGLSDALVERLASLSSLRVLPAEEIREARHEHADAAAVARSLGAAFIVEGSLVHTDAGAEIDAALVAADGRRRPAGRHPAAGNPLDLNRRLAQGLVNALSAEGALMSNAAPSPRAPTDNPDAFAEYSQARIFVERPDVPGNLDHAIRLFQSAIAKDPRFALAHAGLAEAYWAQFRETRDPQWTGRAMAANLEALRIDPARAEVRLSLAVMYNGHGRREDAVEELRRVLELQPRNDNAHRLMAEIQIARSDWDAAVAEAKQAVTLRPSYWRNHSVLGLANFRAGRYEDAAAAYQRVVELQPDSSRGYQTLGTALQAAGQNDAALVQYEKALDINPSARTYSNVGTLYFWRGDYQKAAERYEQAVALAPNDSELHANLGDAYARLGQSSRAAECYRRAVRHVEALLAVSPDDSQHLAALALYEAKLGKHRAAAANVQKALALTPKDGQVLYVTALVGALSGDTARACSALAEAVAHGASHEEIRNAVELRRLKGCAAYDGIVGNVQ
ncbi:serine/threonine-protein kinase [soil metagenome]